MLRIRCITPHHRRCGSLHEWSGALIWERAETVDTFFSVPIIRITVFGVHIGVPLISEKSVPYVPDSKVPTESPWNNGPPCACHVCKH